jgi:hypothetical protein
MPDPQFKQIWREFAEISRRMDKEFPRKGFKKVDELDDIANNYQSHKSCRKYQSGDWANTDSWVNL